MEMEARLAPWVLPAPENTPRESLLELLHYM